CVAHWRRARLRLRCAVLAPLDGDADPVAGARAIVRELERYDRALYDKPRWLVLNQEDLIDADRRAQRIAAFVKAYRWKGPLFAIAAISGEGCRDLVYTV